MTTPLDLIGAAANGTARSPRHRDGQAVSIVQAHGLTVHIDRHAGTVLQGTGPDGKPYQVVQQVDYGFLPGVRGDDGDEYDVYVGAHPACDRVFVVTQLRASNARYDEQKAMLGFPDAAAAERCYRDHTHPTMFGRMGSLSLDAFKAQLAAHAGGESVFRAETDEDAADLAAMDEIEAAPLSDPEPPSSENPHAPQPDAAP